MSYSHKYRSWQSSPVAPSDWAQARWGMMGKIMDKIHVKPWAPPGPALSQDAWAEKWVYIWYPNHSIFLLNSKN